MQITLLGISYKCRLSLLGLKAFDFLCFRPDLPKFNIREIVTQCHQEEADGSYPCPAIRDKVMVCEPESE